MTNCKSPIRQTGFTLLEIVIAVAIFAVISTVSYASLVRYFDQSQKIELAHQRLEQVQKLFALLEQDVRYMVARPVQYNNTTYAALEVYKNRPVFSGEKMQFTTSRPTPLNKMAQTNFRVSWRVENDSIYRYSWTELDLKELTLVDKMPDLQHIQHVVDNIELFEISVFSDGDEQDQTDFNEQAFTNDFDEDLYQLPKLIKILVKTKGGKDYYRVLEVGSASLES